MVDELKVSDEQVLTIATGGFASLFNEKGLFDVIISDLVLQGIKIAYSKNHD